MTLGDKQEEFSYKLALLINFAYANGYKIRRPRVSATEGHMKNSLHYIGLAADLNLFKDGVYLTETIDHTLLGEFWESIGGTWGGRFNDGNHYSIEHEGRK